MIAVARRGASLHRRSGIMLAIVLAALGIVACDGESPTQPGPLARADNCRLPAIVPQLTPQPASETCNGLRPGCPRDPEADSEPIVMLSTCSFAQGETTCTPLQVGCQRSADYRVHFWLVNPRSPTPLCAGEVNARIATTATGAALVEWDALELTPTPDGLCQPSGTELRGAATAPGPCCEGLADIRLPHSGLTFRMAVRTDWQPRQ